jgi:hypothetical protein
LTPFSCNTKYTKVGSQDLLIVAVILAGVSTIEGYSSATPGSFKIFF